MAPLGARGDAPARGTRVQPRSSAKHSLTAPYWFRCRSRLQGEARTIATVYSEHGGWAFAVNRQDGTVERGRENTPQAARIMADTWLGYYGWELLQDPTPPDLRQLLIERVKEMSPQEVLDLSIKAGIHNPDGTLTAK